jgi:SAM-dependent methyltransferase
VAEPNADQRAQWNGEGGERWVADADRRDVVLHPVLEVLLGAAHLDGAENVLDVGCGCGSTTIAAHANLTTGRALGIDISGPMLDVARARCADLERIDFRQADAQVERLEPAFDVVIGRFGTMFFDDPVAAHANLRAAVRSGGRLCLATWQPLDANDWLMVPGVVLLGYGSMPQAESGPGMFAQADPAEVTEVLSAAGWSNITVQPVTVTLTLGTTPEAATDYLADTGIARRVLDTVPLARQAEALASVTSMLTEHQTNDGVQLGAGINLISATT